MHGYSLLWIVHYTHTAINSTMYRIFRMLKSLTFLENTIISVTEYILYIYGDVKRGGDLIRSNRLLLREKIDSFRFHT